MAFELKVRTIEWSAPDSSGSVQPLKTSFEFYDDVVYPKVEYSQDENGKPIATVEWELAESSARVAIIVEDVAYLMKNGATVEKIHP